MLPATAAMMSKTTSRCTCNALASLAARAPAANNKESPGRNGVTTKPVSEKIITKSMA